MIPIEIGPAVVLLTNDRQKAETARDLLHDEGFQGVALKDYRGEGSAGFPDFQVRVPYDDNGEARDFLDRRDIRSDVDLSGNPINREGSDE